MVEDCALGKQSEIVEGAVSKPVNIQILYNVYIRVGHFWGIPVFHN